MPSLRRVSLEASRPKEGGGEGATSPASGAASPRDKVSVGRKSLSLGAPILCLLQTLH